MLAMLGKLKPWAVGELLWCAEERRVHTGGLTGRMGLLGPGSHLRDRHCIFRLWIGAGMGQGSKKGHGLGHSPLASG